MKPFSMDLRERVRAALHAGELTQPQIAAKYDLTLRTVENWARQLRETGHLAIKLRRHGPVRRLAECEPLIRQLVQTQPDVTLNELCAQVASQTNRPSSPSMMCRELKHLRLPRKKSSARQSTRNRTRAKTTGGTSRQDRDHALGHRPAPKIHR